jgi:hypothetical protein
VRREEWKRWSVGVDVSCFLFMPLRAAWAGERIVYGRGTKYTQEICYIPLAMETFQFPTVNTEKLPWLSAEADSMVSTLSRHFGL